MSDVCKQTTVNNHSDNLNAEIISAMYNEPLLAGLDDAVVSKLIAIVYKLMEGQKVLNLTSIRQPGGIVRYHIADSLALIKAVSKFAGGILPDRAADIGTGGGFPMLPMATAWPSTEWTGIESVGKKATFVLRTAETVGLDNVTVHALRAEDVGRTKERGTFDLVTSRAVGPVSSLLEVGMPLLKEGGQIYLFKTSAARDEWNNCALFLQKLGGRQAGIFQYKLEGDEQERLIFVADKISFTPDEFPRLAGVPFKKPFVQPTKAGAR